MAGGAWWQSLRAQVAAWRTPRPLGARGEAAAARFLQRLGYRIVERGARSRLGEIDLVAVDQRTVVFVEVKTRSSESEGGPAAAVDLSKQRRLTRAALHFLRTHDLLECRARFDILAVVWPPGERRPQIQHILNAFEPSDRNQMFT